MNVADQTFLIEVAHCLVARIALLIRATRLSHNDMAHDAGVVCGALSMPVAGGQDLGTSGRFQLFDDCKPMGLEVGHGFGSALDLGIYMKDVRAAAKSRLREAHLYSSDNPPSLYVDMSGYAIQLKYKKRVRDLASGEIGSVWTFSKAAGVRDGTRATIMLELSNLLDTFLVEYLRANESACGQMVTGSLKPEEVSTDTPERSPPAADINAAEPSLFRIGNSVKSPRLIRKREPRYTEKAKEAKLEGVVLLELEVWEDGKAHNIRVLRPLGLGLDERAIEAVEKWKFAPCTKDGKPVRVLAQILVSFRLL